MPTRRPAPLPTLPAALLAVLGGLCLWQSWPRGDHWYLAIVGIALGALATRARRGRTGFALATLLGLGAYLPALHWSGVYVGNLPWVALSILQALYVGLTGLAHARLTRRTGDVRPVVLALAWTAGEMLRSTTPFGGFPWIKIAYSQGDSPMLPLARYLSSTGLTFAVALAGGLLAAAVVRVSDARRERRALLLAIGSAVGTVALVAGPALVSVPTDGPTAQVLAIQGNVPQAGLDFNAQRRAVLDHHVQQTLLAAKEIAAGTRPRPDVVVWPENASDIDPLRNPDAGDEITKASVAVGAPIIVGGLEVTPQGRIRNTSWYWDGTKGPTTSYSKRHPVPFGEYIPYRSFFRTFSDKVDLVTADMQAGEKVGVMTVPGTRAVPLSLGLGICFEVAYDDVLLDTLTHGATILAVQTNNATFGYTDESYQQIGVSRVRAVEYGRSVVHVSTVGTSGLITPDGVVHEQTGLFVPGRLSMALPLRTELTPAVRIGEWPGRTALLLTLVQLAADTLRRRTNTQAAPHGATRGEHSPAAPDVA